MQVILEHVQVQRGAFNLRADGIIREGIHLIWGSVGSGKSTLALLLAGCLAVREGAITRSGIVTTRLSLQFPEYQVTSRTLVGEIQSWGGEVDRVLTAIGLTDRAKEDPLTLSRGELKRLQLACALQSSPDLLLLDEPFSALDCRERENAIQVIQRRRTGITILFTHDPGILPRIEYLWELEGGELRYRGKVPEAFSHWSSPPAYMRFLLEAGVIPKNLAFDDLQEAVCRIPD
jgi:energy-coupling factor transporter ATP-binding protein EcfA2